MDKKRYLLIFIVFTFVLVFVGATQFSALAWTAVDVTTDPLVRMPGTQPGAINLDDSGQCANCHENYDSTVEPTHNWRGSMMAQSARDFLYLATMTVAAQDAIWAIGNPNATDICLRCHFPVGWINEHSDPTNASAMTRGDFDGVQCTICHYMFDPFFEDTYAGTREGADPDYWDEASTVSTDAATVALGMDQGFSASFTMFNTNPFFDVSTHKPPSTYTENGSGQYFIGDSTNRRGPLADTDTTHGWYYSRYHKSKYFCSTCHDISNPVLANLNDDPADPLTTETTPAYAYYHVERTFSEFMLSDYGLQGGAEGVGPFAPSDFNTSKPDNLIATCQDCHMRDVTGDAANNTSITRPTESTEHPNSGISLHDLTGGNVWVPNILASTISGSANYSSTNDTLLNNKYDELTLDLSTNQTIGFDSSAALIDGANRSLQMLQMSAVISDVRYSPTSGNLSFEVRNQTGHKLISGFPEGRRMFVNIKYYDAGDNLLFEVNPYDETADTLKGLEFNGVTFPYTTTLTPPAALSANEVHVDELVYEMHGSSSFTGEDETFHFVLSDGRYKDNRIPPKGFRITEATDRLSQPVWGGVSALDYFTAAEYAGGYDLVSMQNDFDPPILVPGADRIEISLNYQTTSREYIEFLYNEINGTSEGTLSGTGAGGNPPYLIQTDSFFTGLSAWGGTIWDLWYSNRNSPGGAPIAITTGQWDSSSPTNVSLLQFEGTSASTLDLEFLLLIPALIGLGILTTLIQRRRHKG